MLHRDRRQIDRQRPRCFTEQLGQERTGTIIQEPIRETLKYLSNFQITSNVPYCMNQRLLSQMYTQQRTNSIYFSLCSSLSLCSTKEFISREPAVTRDGGYSGTPVVCQYVLGRTNSDALILGRESILTLDCYCRRDKVIELSVLKTYHGLSVLLLSG